ETLSITSVTQRLYRGFRRSPAIYAEVRDQFLSKKSQVFEIIDGLGPSFDNPKEFAEARKFIAEFFTILEDDSKYKSRILNKARTK
ncbi:MAG: hypothetical protein KJN76_06230, partial [Eudoraea sp.]|nr:hypothetical protein [Eudoraea sp.]